MREAISYAIEFFVLPGLMCFSCDQPFACCKPSALIPAPTGRATDDKKLPITLDTLPFGAGLPVPVGLPAPGVGGAMPDGGGVPIARMYDIVGRTQKP